jgi:hypothetical protein
MQCISISHLLSCLVLSCLILFCFVLFCFVLFCFLVWFGLVWFGLVWFGLVWFGLVWFGLVWFSLFLVFVLTNVRGFISRNRGIAWLIRLTVVDIPSLHFCLPPYLCTFFRQVSLCFLSSPFSFFLPSYPLLSPSSLTSHTSPSHCFPPLFPSPH